MGRVQRVRDRAGAGIVALKTSEAPEHDEAIRREFELLSRLRHPALPVGLELGAAPGGRAAFTQTWVAGEPPRPGTLTEPRQLAALAARLLHVLCYLHRSGLVYLDLKPDNILCPPGAGPHLVDLGLARDLGRHGAGITGTVHYFAPELLRGEPVDGRADLYSLGLLLVHLRTGHLPFRAAGGNALAREKIEEGGAVVERARLAFGGDWGDWIASLLAPDPGRRCAGTERALESMPEDAPAPAPRDAEIMGREAPLALVAEALDAASAQGRGGIFVVRAPEGAGTSRLMIEALRRAQLRGIRAARLVTGPGDPARRLQHALASFAPGRAGDSTDPLDRVLVAIDAAGRTGGAALFAIEAGDDAATLTVLRQCAAATTDLPLVVLCDRVVESPARETLDLPALGVEDVASVTARAWGQDAAERFAAKLRETTGGNPRFLLALLGSGPPHAARMPDSMVALFDERARSLPEPAQALLDLLSCVSIPVDLATVAEARSRSEADMRRELAELTRRGLVTESAPSMGSSAVHFELALRELGDRRAARLEAAERRALHERLAGALAARRGPAEAGERARQRELAGDAAGARADALLVARHEEATGEQRIDALRGALRLRPPAESRAALEDELAECLGRAGRVDEALALLSEEGDGGLRRLRIRGELQIRRACFDAAWTDLTRVMDAPAGDRSGAEAEPAKAAMRLVRLLEGRGEIDAALDCARTAMTRSAAASQDHREARNVFGSLLLAAGRGEEAEAELELVLRHSRDAGDRREEAGAWNNLGLAAMARGAWSEAGERFQRGLEMQTDLGDLAKQATGWDNLGVAAHRAGDDARAIRALERGLRYRVRIGDPKRIADSHNNIGALCYTRREHSEAARHLERALQLRRALGIPADISKTLNNLALVHSSRGELGEARACLEQSIELKRGLDDAVGVANSCVNLAATVLRAGDPARAHRLLDEVAAYADRERNDELRLSVLEHRAPAHLSSGRPDLALAAALGAVDLQGGEGARVMHALLAAIDANLALGRVPEALHLAARASTTVESSGTPEGLQAALHRRLAEVHIGAGDLPSATIHRGQAWTALQRGVGDPEEGECLRMEGDLLLARGRTQEAMAAFERAVDHHRRWGGRLALAMAYARLGDAAARCGAAQRAREAQQEARKVQESMGNEWRRGGADQPEASGAGPDPLEILRRVGGMLTGLGDPDEVLHGALSVVLETIGAERGQVFLLDPGSGELQIRVARNMDPETSEDAAHHSRTILERTLSERTVLFSDDAQSDEDFRHFQSVARYKIVSFICVPMVSRGRAMGTIYVDNRSVVNRFDRSDADFMQVFASLAAIAVENALLTRRLVRENEELRREAREEWELPNVVGRSPAMQRIAEVVRKVAATRSIVLLLGETGTGKEVLARAIHYESERADQHFVAVDCGALQPTLIESELFGHRRGAFSGAVADKPGLFEEADGGTIFLDEITNMELGLQAKLLRVLQEGEVRRLGDTRARRVDVRVICATNRDLRQAVDAGEFREDLYFRINIVPISLPALRERPSDIAPLTAHFLERIQERIGRPIQSISPRVRDALLAHDWPGNVRELQNTLEGMAVLCTSDQLTEHDLPVWLTERAAEPAATLSGGERRSLVEALEEAEWIQTRAARKLGVSERVMRYKMKKHGIANPRRGPT